MIKYTIKPLQWKDNFARTIDGCYRIIIDKRCKTKVILYHDFNAKELETHGFSTKEEAMNFAEEQHKKAILEFIL